MRILKLFLILNHLIALYSCLKCLKCNGCSTNSLGSLETCTEANSQCFKGIQFGFVYQGCTALSAFQLASFYTNIQMCSSDYCNKNTQSISENKLKCFYCLGCSTSSSNILECPNLSYTCYSGIKSGKVYQGCTNLNYDNLSTMYSNVKLCSTNYCNEYNQVIPLSLTCYSCQGCDPNVINRRTEKCPDESYNCFNGNLNGLLYQGCSQDMSNSLVYNYKNFQICSENLCNMNSFSQGGLSCFSCTGCMSYDANKKKEICKDFSYRCFTGTVQGFTHQGCTKWVDSSLSAAYKNVKTCNQNLCNTFSVLNVSQIKKHNFFLSLAILLYIIIS
ncbi:unnamed protein product [Brachionus calyciflorus]|uniref:Uncharacterized protein n=1 Tax=Brachionus calyciflorus TaxID=104777 RepID=A0A814E2E6_9BILA|nr:unnamed protein product [Brachionus calyciflorus]